MNIAPFLSLSVNGSSFAQCGISMYPTNWIKEELNDNYTTLMALANFQPDSPNGFENTVELEAWDGVGCES
jgi:hypothetical protein